MPRLRSQTQDDVRFQILRCLYNDSEMSQRRLPKGIGISVGSAHSVLKSLVDQGLVKLGSFNAGPDKRSCANVLTAAELAEKALLTRVFLRPKMVEYLRLKADIGSLSCEVEAACQASI